MRFGIDFGTTRTVVAAVDGGNHPLLAFASEDDDTVAREWLPSRYEGEGSFKRHLGRARLGDPAFERTAGFLRTVAEAIRRRSNMRPAEGEPLEAVVGVPANASTTWRFLTVEAFRAAGFEVLAVVNEPSAAGLEFAHRHRRAITSVREHVLVYDLGGGTFDASLIDMGDHDHRVLASAGLAELGGDDFDRAICDLVIERASLSALEPAQESALLAECCLKKESIVPQTRRIIIDLPAIGLSAPALVLPVDDIYERCAPLVQRTMDVLTEPLRAAPDGGIEIDAVAGIYVVGGASSLPIVARQLKEKFGRRVHRSPYSFAATAIGLAIAADASSGYALTDCFTRHFGVWRESDAGTRARFDPIFTKNTPLPAVGEPPLASVRTYRARHDVGHFRFLECSHLDAEATPTGDLMLRSEVRFPFDAKLRDLPSLDQHVVATAASGPWVEERYECGSDGIVHLEVRTDDGYRRRYQLG